MPGGASGYGGGVDSTAMLVGLNQRGIRPDLILMADPGSEMTPTLSISWSAPELIVPWILAMATFHERYEHQKWN
jgi:hypothetical protein